MDYLASLTDKQKLAIEIAKQQLKTSYTMEKSNGYVKHKEKVKPSS
jgi:hypothetical protein